MEMATAISDPCRPSLACSYSSPPDPMMIRNLVLSIAALAVANVPLAAHSSPSPQPQQVNCDCADEDPVIVAKSGWTFVSYTPGVPQPGTCNDLDTDDGSGCDEVEGCFFSGTFILKDPSGTNHTFILVVDASAATFVGCGKKGFAKVYDNGTLVATVTNSCGACTPA